jgi:hypothetical protein
MTRRGLDRERQIACALQGIIHLLLAGALAAFLVIYLRNRPSADLPAWLAYGFPIAICMGILHFGRRSLLFWKRLRKP